MNRVSKRDIPDDQKFIDIEKVIANKNPGLIKILPPFVLRYVKHILHEDQINRTVSKFKHLQGLEFIEAVLDDFGLTTELIGEHNLPTHNKLIIACNHPFGGPDGMTLMYVIGKHKKNLKFLVNDLLLNIENLKDLFIPINKHGRNPKETVILMDKIYSSGNVVLTFPYGLVSRKQNKKIQDLIWHKNFITKAKKYNRNIVPVFIKGRNSNFFYNLAYLRKLLRIKANIEMFYLSNEMFKQVGKDIPIYVGKEIPYTVFDKRYSDAQWAEKIRKFVYRLPDNIDAIFDPEFDY